MKKYLMMGALLLGSLITQSALADEGDQCENDCPSNQKKVGFADGTKATCICVEESSGMDETVPDYSVQGPGPSDGEPMPESET